MAGRLGRGHAHVDARSRHDGLEVNVEAVRKHQQRARLKVRPDLLGIQLGRGLIGNQDHHHVGPLCGLGDRGHFKPRLLRLGDRLRVGRQAHLHLHAGILQVQRVRMPLRAVTDNGHLLRLDQREVGIVIVISLRHDFLGFPLHSGLEFLLIGLVWLPVAQCHSFQTADREEIEESVEVFPGLKERSFRPKPLQRSLTPGGCAREAGSSAFHPRETPG